MGSATFTTGRPAVDVLDSATSYFAGEGFTTTTRSENIVTFSKRTGPNPGVAILLLILMILPGIIYIVADRGTNTVSVSVRQIDSDRTTTTVTMSWDGGKGDKASRGFVDLIVKAEPKMASA